MPRCQLRPLTRNDERRARRAVGAHVVSALACSFLPPFYRGRKGTKRLLSLNWLLRRRRLQHLRLRWRPRRSKALLKFSRLFIRVICVPSSLVPSRHLMGDSGGLAVAAGGSSGSWWAAEYSLKMFKDWGGNNARGLIWPFAMLPLGAMEHVWEDVHEAPLCCLPCRWQDACTDDPDERQFFSKCFQRTRPPRA